MASAGCNATGVLVVVIAMSIILMITVPALGYAVFGVILSFAILAAVWSLSRKNKRNVSHTSVLPTSAQQAGGACDIRSAPDANIPTFTWDHGRGENVVLQPPPPAVMRGIGNRASGSYLPHLMTHPESPTLLPMYMDGTDG